MADVPTRLLLAAGAVGAVAFVLVWAIEGATRAGYRASQLPISALSLGDRGWVQVVDFLIGAAGLLAFAAGIHRALAGRPGAVWAVVLLVVCALGLVASGAFPMDPPVGDPAAEPVTTATTRTGALHAVAGLAVFATLPSAAVLLAVSLWTDATYRGLAVCSLAAGVAMVAATVAWVVVDQRGRAGAGLLQRTAIAIGWGWVVVAAVVVLLADRAVTR